MAYVMGNAMRMKHGHLAWLRWPVVLPWRAASLVEKRLGIPTTLLIGLGLGFTGLILTTSLVGMLAGIPLLFFGTLFVLRALY